MRLLRRGDIVIGTPIAWPIYDRAGMLLLQRGGIVETDDQLEVLLDRECQIADGEQFGGSEASDSIKFAPPPPFEAMLQLRVSVDALHRRLLAGTERNLQEKIEQQIATLEDALTRDTDATLASMQLQLDPNDHAARQTHAAIICAFATHSQHLGIGTAKSLISAALTYDIALTPLSTQLNSQSEKLTDAQQEKVRDHPAMSAQLLEAAGVNDPVWLDAVRHHHERLDGSGYPYGLKDEQIQPAARLLGIIDIYTAMLRPRIYRSALPARVALRNIFMERGKLIDASFAAILIKDFGVYPPGTLVELVNKEIGIVLHRGADAAHPQVARLMTPEGYRASVTTMRDTSKPEFQIIDSVPHERYPGLLINISRLWN